MTVYAIAIGKGGTGKSTTAAALTDYLRQQGRRVLAVDMDRQGNLSSLLGIPPDYEGEVEAVTHDVLTGAASLEQAATNSPTLDGVQVLVGTTDLGQLTPTEVPDLVTSLRDELASTAPTWDDVVIDTPPSLGPLTLAGLAAAEVIVCACSTDQFAVEQVEQLHDVIAGQVARRLNKSAHVSWIVPTMHDARAASSRAALDTLTSTYPERVTTPIRWAQTIRSAALAGLPVTTFRPKSAAAQDYCAILNQITSEAKG